MNKDYKELKELAVELREIYRGNRKSNREGKFTTFFNYLNNNDFTKTTRKRLFQTLMRYQYFIGRCKKADVFEEINKNE